MGRTGRLRMSPCSCRTGLPGIGLPGRCSLGHRSCRTGTGIVRLRGSRGPGLCPCRAGLCPIGLSRSPSCGRCSCLAGPWSVWLFRRGVPRLRSCGAGPGCGSVERSALGHCVSCRTGTGAVRLLGRRCTRLSPWRCLGTCRTGGLSAASWRYIAGRPPGAGRYRASPALLSLWPARAALTGSVGIAGRRRLLGTGPGRIFLPGVGLLCGPLGGAVLLRCGLLRVGLLCGTLLAGIVGTVPPSTPRPIVRSLGAAKSATAAGKAPAAK